MRVTFASPQRDVDLNRACIRRLVNSLARGEKTKGGEVSLVFVDDAFIRELKRRYLGVKVATDVLAFPLGEDVSSEGPPRKGGRCCGGPVGEVYVSAERAIAQARRYHVGLSQEIARLIVHGVLHLLGYADDTPPSRRRMILRQEAFLREHKALACDVARRARPRRPVARSAGRRTFRSARLRRNERGSTAEGG